jgi:hypothetical protein
MSEERFMEMVDKYHGFEFVQAYRDDKDHYLGGKGNTYWYVITQKGRRKEAYIATLENGGWKDVYVKGEGEKKKVKDMEPGTTIRLIARMAYYLQDESWVQRKPSMVNDNHPHKHYVYRFGEKGLDISEEFGVTITFSDINDVSKGFHLRDVSTGDDVETESI